MEIHELNLLLAQGITDQSGQFPHLDQLIKLPYHFQVDFGLRTLPEEPGILLIRGARQYGKSTWLEGEIKKTIEAYGPGSAYYLNGEYLSDANELESKIKDLLGAYSKTAKVRRLFIDEITAVPQWELALKRLADRGLLENILVITTGSKATDLRRAHESLPGRRGKLARTTYLFTPVSYQEFHRLCSKRLRKDTLTAYLLSGGSPLALSALAQEGHIPEYIIELTRDWIEGEISAAGRARASLFNIMQTLFRYGTKPVGQAKLAREANLANNTAAANYIDILNDLGCINSAFPWDDSKHILILRKPCKFHFTNLLVAVAYHPKRIRSIADFNALDPKEQGAWLEWLIAQELIRRAAISNKAMLAPLAFWQSKEHEIDFCVSSNSWIEVKRGASSRLEFSWFGQSFPQKKLTVINTEDFETQNVKGISIENYLLNGT